MLKKWQKNSKKVLKKCTKNTQIIYKTLVKTSILKRPHPLYIRRAFFERTLTPIYLDSKNRCKRGAVVRETF